MIKAADPQASYFEYKGEIDQAISDVLAGGTYINGKHVYQFCQEFARYIDPGSYCVGMGCGTDALILAMQALGIDGHHEVVVGAYVPLPVIAAIVAVGATPAIVDVKEDLTIDPNEVAQAITAKTRAILAVHIFGNPCDMDVLTAFAECSLMGETFFTGATNFASFSIKGGPKLVW